ncbi:uncharacterized protein LOC116223757 isoform X2 [Clupea harengus]|uniref:Uncharacterized protein LOC116223757 isoform X2 n=1 Tax=Clupea harengus TaxID=7950 RepID=A0A6P8GPZ2_CLUHA|nr:uncharacterized protein LOC116223757 isoform X2 [Clupea harengus]
MESKTPTRKAKKNKGSREMESKTPAEKEKNKGLHFRVPKTQIKVYVTTYGNTMNSDTDFLDRLSSQRKIEKVDAKECHVILAFCPIVSRAGTDIEAALGDLKARHGSGKPIIVVGLYHTFDREHVVPASSNYDESTFIVNCLFYEGSGILNCDQNTEAINQTSKKLKAFKKKNKSLNEMESKTPARKKKKKGLNERVPNTQIKVYVTTHGNTMNSDTDFLDRLSSQCEIEKVDANECDVILAFSPIVSRAGTDIEAALGDLKARHGSGKPIIVVGLYHTFDREHVVPASRNYDESTFRVYCLFCEGSGILNCDQNTEAINQTLQKLKKLQKEKKNEVSRKMVSETPAEKEKENKGSREKESKTPAESTTRMEENQQKGKNKGRGCSIL